ncbi:MAG: ATP-binding cassette domain-containing protein [Candidatus Dependentiae bacterium]
MKGAILINGIDIYQVTDAMRSRLIALQGQVASNLRGTIKNNLLLGLPNDHGFSDDQLISVLDQVGLLTILNNHNGIETVLGEGGLNLSGGQRQRLNFAALYLRGLFYKPLLILIDEPTSSLDEISELAITRMIEHLAHESVTLVVAHRLKTIQKAVGIIDLSLLDQEKIIEAYDQHTLLSKSAYYKELIHGVVQLDN